MTGGKLPTRPCDVCGEPATHHVRDQVRKDLGQRYEYSPVTTVRAGCDKHKVHSVTIDEPTSLWQ